MRSERDRNQRYRLFELFYYFCLMDAEFWIYIIIGAIYFISRLLKKGQQVTDEGPQPPQRERRNPTAGPPSEEGTRPMTFEELLREITEGKQVQRQPPQPKPQPIPAPRYERYERDLGDEARNLEETGSDEVESAQKWQAYEQVPTTERRSLEETLHLEDTVMDFNKFEAFRKKDDNRLSEDYIKLLRNPQTLKQAVVMSEILKRKF